MNICNESIKQVQKDIEELTSDISKLFKCPLENQGQTSPQDTKLCSIQSEDYLESSKSVLYRAKYFIQHRPVTCLGLMALIGGAIGAGIYRKNHKCS